MKRVTFLILLFVVGVCLTSFPHAEKRDVPADELLRHYFDLHTHPERSATISRLESANLVKRFYDARAWQPAWVENNRSRPLIMQLITMLNNAGQDGLNRTTYHVDFFNAEFNDAKSKNREIQISADLLLTDAFLTYSDHLLHGQVRPETIYKDWRAVERERDVVSVLDDALASGEIEQTISKLYPVSKVYSELRSRLLQYREIDSQVVLPAIPSGPSLRSDSVGPRVALIKRILSVFDGPIDSIDDVFDSATDKAVRQFQKRHGLEVDGIVGNKTLSALNVPLEQRIKQIEINLERIRWLPNDPGKKFIVVNIADFSLHVIENHRSVLNSRVIVGKRYHETPVFSKDMTYLALSPYWNVPRSIAVKEILPRLRKDPGYLKQQGMRIFDKSSGRGINPASVNWTLVSSRDFPYRFRQDPGSGNALGRVKFMFPNAYNVYLHDTPAQELFARNVRDFSHGCIRVEKAMDLANYLLQDQPLWNHQRVDDAMQAGKEQIVRLKAPIPVHILYITAWVEEGMVHFRDDIYGRDKRMISVLGRTRSQRL